MSLVVIVPSRGRPHSVAGLAEAFADTTREDTRLWIAVDSDDPDLARYRDAVTLAADHRVTVAPVLGGYMSVALNEAATAAAGDPAVDAVGFMGDDHRPRTGGWDTAYLAAIAEMGGVGIVYGDDGLQSEALPTQCAMSSNIVRTLGWMCPPVLRHLWIDNFWLDLGRAAGCLRYLPNVVVEHMHPYVGKAEMDEGYVRVNSDEMIDADRTAYELYTAERLARDVEKVRALRG